MPLPGECAPQLTDEAAIYDVLVLGVRDYINKNGFGGAVLGLSGGIDSALTLVLAVDAIGADRVEAVMMPFTCAPRGPRAGSGSSHCSATAS